ncbi:MAG: S-methyl-5-thioribose-1-phosphate isomerase, partial [Candidatus Woesearchaeota archaeon]
MLINNKQYRTVWFDKNKVRFINQLLLPHKFKIIQAKDYKSVAHAIKHMYIRGAPAIGAIAAYGMALAVLKINNFSSIKRDILKAAHVLKSSRPTAHDLFHAVDFMTKEILISNSVKEARSIGLEKSEEYAMSNIAECKKIGIFGEKLIKDGDKILVHCNAGALATVDYGTALSPIRFAHYNKKKIFVFVDETRPSFQGAKLTAWELLNEGIPHAVI